ncbi:dihydrolipoamide acetyltransferase family protein [Pseudoclavibacter soli]|uniref:dihydrolipoamide acetyltransferase family protein n=1 Tax=Pseudoclavibacter soli TaxID=452623 RepID=UPI00041050E1|nr:dihydrolipoamide acetyltransferase family protein [Pseudoclavibacter soli]
MIENFTLPDVGEGLTEAEIVSWLVAPGDRVEVNQSVVEIETAKSVVELPVPFSGVVTRLHAEPGETVELGDVLLEVETAGAPGAGAPEAAAAAAAAAAAPAAAAPASCSRGEESAKSTVGVNQAHPHNTFSPLRSGPADTPPNLVGYGASDRPKSRRAHRQASSLAAQAQTQAPAQLAGSAAAQTQAHAEASAPGQADSDASAQNHAHTLAQALRQASAQTEPHAAGQRPEQLPAQAPAQTHAAQAPGARSADRPAATVRPPRRGGIPVIARPPIRKLAKDLGVHLSDVAGTGPAGEVTRQDVIDHAQQASVFRNIETPAWPAEREQIVPVVPASGGTAADDREEIVKVHGVRRSIAKAMTSSAFTAPHVTVFVEVDATHTMEYVKRLKSSPRFADVKVSPLLIMARAVIWAAQRSPEVNSSFDEEQITIHHYVNLGIAAATPRGLLVPNIKEAQRLSLRELAQALADLTATARAGRTQPAEMSGGTITITNIGVFGMDAGTPILNPGEVAIVAMGAIRQKPWVVDGEVRPRYVTTVSASFDHRVVDGDVASRFTADVASVLEEPALLLDE